MQEQEQPPLQCTETKTTGDVVINEFCIVNLSQYYKCCNGLIYLLIYVH